MTAKQNENCFSPATTSTKTAFLTNGVTSKHAERDFISTIYKAPTIFFDKEERTKKNYQQSITFLICKVNYQQDYINDALLMI